MKADRYYGAIACNYDKTRQDDGTWTAENALIERLVTEGPILDVPFGTGRYVPIYNKKGLKYLGVDVSLDMLAQAKKKFTNVRCEVGSIFSLPKGYKTAVCTRLLNWLYPEQLRMAMGQLSEAAETLIFSARTGEDGDRRKTSTYTHSTNTLKQLIGGRLWEQHHIGSLAHGEYIMVKARKPIWADVVKAFVDRPKGTIDKLTKDWSVRINVEQPQLSENTPVAVEWWTHDELGGYVDRIALVDPGMIVNRLPRSEKGPLVTFKRDGKYGMIDGRCRANLWRNVPGVYPVIVMGC